MSSGILEVDGTLASPILVASQATLAGGGSTSKDVTVQPGGILSSGPVGTNFHVGGNLTLMPQSIFAVSVDPSGGKSSVSVDGSAVINSAALQIAAGGIATSYLPATTYTILSTQHGVSGNFGLVTTTLAMLAPQVTYGSNDVTLTFTQLPAPGGGAATGINGMTGSASGGTTGSGVGGGSGATTGSGTTGNSGGSGGSVTSGTGGSSSPGSGSSSPNGTLVTGLDNLNQGGLAAALSSLGASSYAAIRRADLFDADEFARKVAEHRFTDTGSTPVDSHHGWLEIEDRRTSIGAADDLQVNQAGIIGGVEITPADDGLVALSGQILHSNLDLGAGNNASSNRFDLGVTAAKKVRCIRTAGDLKLRSAA